jgi:hypothetical protein
MYLDVEMPGARGVKIFEDGKSEKLGLVCAIDTDEGYIIEYRLDMWNRAITTEFKGKHLIKAFKRYGNFRLEGFKDGTI